MRKTFKIDLFTNAAPVCAAAILCAISAVSARAQETPATPPSTEAPTKQPYNILLVLCDQEQYKLLAASGYELPARQRLEQKGIVFQNHYVASTMCSPSRAALLTGQPPQKNGVFDQMEYSYVSSLDPSMPNMGSVLKGLGYTTAYFGKYEMDKSLIATKNTVNYSTALRPYGFDTFSATGDVGSRPDSGFMNDVSTSGEVASWLRTNAVHAGKGDKPFFMVTSFLNPHDIMYANANMPGESVQKGLAASELTTPPNSVIFQKSWQFTLPVTLTESLKAPGMPAALAEYSKGWSGALGEIPADRSDMWRNFNNYYLNLIRDNDTSLQQIVDTLDELDLWKNTIVIFTADHGEMGGSHGGIRGKGPFAYEENSKVPFIVVHPDYPAGKSNVLTSHLDLLPTFVGFTGLPEAQRQAATKGLPGRDFSSVLAQRDEADVNAVRPGVLFNYVGPSTIDADFCIGLLSAGATGQKAPTLESLRPKLGKRGFLSFAFDGRYKFARYYAPDAFNTPKTLEEILKSNDVQLFDLQLDPNESNNLALDPEKNKDTILRMNDLLNDLMAQEVGVNDGSFLPKSIRPKGEVAASAR